MRHLKHYDGGAIAEHDPEWVHTTPTYTAEDCTITMLGRLAYTPDAFVPGIATVHKWIEHRTTGRLRRVLLNLDRAVYMTHGGLDARRIPFAWIAPRRPDAPPRDPDDRRQWHARAALAGRLCNEPAGDGLHRCINPTGHAGYHVTELDSCGGWRAEITWAAAETTTEGNA